MRKGPGKPLQCRLVCNRGGEAVCGKDLASDNPAGSTKDHYTWGGCKGLRVEAGQVLSVEHGEEQQGQHG